MSPKARPPVDMPALQDAVRQLLRALGEPERAGIADTPARVARAWAHMLSGHDVDPAALLATQFDLQDEDPELGPYGGIVLVRDIEFHSTCEHHMLPIIGKAHVGYIPGPQGHVVGLSKLARLVDVFAHRLQCQERMTRQIAHALDTCLKPDGVLVVVEAEHFCMHIRGVEKYCPSTTTSEVRGILSTDEAARAEVLSLIYGRRTGWRAG